MRYSFHKVPGESLYRLAFEGQDVTQVFEFASDIRSISNVSGMTRLFGTELEMDNPDYHLYPLVKADKGDLIITEVNQKFSRFDFGKEGLLQGEWILRKLSDGRTLFWKPYSTIDSMVTKDVSILLGKGEELLKTEQQFSVFMATINDHKFSGTLVAEGVWTGGDLHTTLFDGRIIKSITQQMGAGIQDMLVDFNHDFVSAGHLTKVESVVENGIETTYIEGISEKPIPEGAGLSLAVKSTLKWNSDLNVFVLLEAAPIGASIMTKTKPACTICMIR